jgi:hypothetical protein
MLFRTLNRANAATYSLIAMAPLALGIGAAIWVLQSEPVNYVGLVENATKPYSSPAPVTPPPVKPSDEPEESQARGSVIAARFDSIKNRPVPIPPETVDPGTIETPPTPTESIGDIKYVGPVRLGPVMLAVMNIEGKQQAVGKGKSITYTVDSAPRTAKVKAVTETEVILEVNGAEQIIAKGDSSGDVLTWVGGAKPARSKTVSMKKNSAPKSGAHPLDANASSEYLAKKNEALASMAPLLDQIAKTKSPEIAAKLKEKMISAAKAKGLDPSVIEEEVERIKESGGEK